MLRSSPASDLGVGLTFKAFCTEGGVDWNALITQHAGCASKGMKALCDGHLCKQKNESRSLIGLMRLPKA